MEKTIEDEAREYGLKNTERGDETGYSAKYLAYLAGAAAERRRGEQLREALELCERILNEAEVTLEGVKKVATFTSRYSHYPQVMFKQVNHINDAVEAARAALQNIQKL